jgi:nucleoside-diphosphate-sugar epimerase
MHKNRCLVTGASGYIGSRLVRRLIGKGYQPAVVLRPTSSLKHLQEIGVDNIIRFDYKGDVESLKEAVQFSNTVFHLATSNTFERQTDTVDDMLNARVRFGMHILEAMHNGGGGIFVGTGTIQQYFSTLSFGHRSYYYSLTKAFEEIVQSYSLDNIDVTMLRIHDNYGPTDYRNKVIPSILKALITGMVVSLSDGFQELDLLFIDDILDAYIWAGFEQNNEKPAYRYYDVIANEVISIRDIVKKFEKIADDAQVNGLRFDALKWNAIPRRPDEHEQYVSKNIVPCLINRIKIDEGLRRTLLEFVDFYRGQFA